jgi:DNA (cytosine-5)-methyltransferase 1
MRVIWQSEIDPYANRVLKKHWPEVPNLGNIKDIDWQSVERPAVICGGYPCQPFSTAGNRKGEEDSRHLWPWVRQAISELRPQYAILENVRGHLSLGGTTVIADLASIGYDAEWRIVSAASVGANHRRDRIIIVAYPNSERTQVPFAGRQSGIALFRSNGEAGRVGDVADSNDSGSGTPRRTIDGNGQEEKQGWHDLAQSELGGCSQNVADSYSRRSQECVFNNIAIQQLANASGSITANWETEPDVGRVANGIPNRVDRLKGLGNAVVPQVAEVIGRLVVEHATHN